MGIKNYELYWVNNCDVSTTLISYYEKQTKYIKETPIYSIKLQLI